MAASRSFDAKFPRCDSCFVPYEVASDFFEGYPFVVRHFGVCLARGRGVAAAARGRHDDGVRRGGILGVRSRSPTPHSTRQGDWWRRVRQRVEIDTGNMPRGALVPDQTDPRRGNKNTIDDRERPAAAMTNARNLE